MKLRKIFNKIFLTSKIYIRHALFLRYKKIVFIVKYQRYMKEYFKTNTVTYNLISFTGFKALILFALLMESPKSYEEVCDFFLNHPHLKEKISIDTFRVYITSLKRVGCEIKRERIDKVSKYSIVSHPFELSLTEEQIQSLIKIYKNITKNIDIKDLLLLEKFLEKIASYIDGKALKETLENNSILKGYNKSIIEDLIFYCDNKDQIVMRYNSPNSGEKDIEILTDKLEFNNNKLYLYGTGFEYMEYGIFLVSRILEIKEVKEIKTIPVTKNTKIGYKISNSNLNHIQLDTNEKIIQKTKDYSIIEITSSNDFLTRQKLLSYGPMCKILYPESFQKDFISRLKKMKAGYFDV